MTERFLRFWHRHNQTSQLDTPDIYMSKNHSISSETPVDWSNPWLALSVNTARGFVTMHKELEKRESHTPEQPIFVPKSSSSPAWLGETLSPYGLADEDGTLKQVDSPSWRGSFAHRRFGGRRPQSTSTTMGRSSTAMRQSTKEKGSTWTLQLLAALILVTGGWYAHLDHTSLAKRMQNVYQSALSQDLTERLLPVLRHLTRADPQLLSMLSPKSKTTP